jgi:ABC-type bacteriocin/lantibiotic exporter with double-glycine peptidase domain
MLTCHSDAEGTLRWLLRHAKPSLLTFAGGFALGLLAGLFAVIDPLLIKWIVDTALPSGKTSAVLLAFGALVLANAIRMVMAAFSAVVMFKATHRAMLRLRKALISHVASLSIDFHAGAPGSRLLFLVERDVEQLIETGSAVIAQVLTLSTSICMTFAALIYLNPILLAIAPPVNVLFGLLRRKFASRLDDRSARVQEAGSTATSILQEHLTNITQIQLLGCQLPQLRRTVQSLAERTRAEWSRFVMELALTNSSMGLVVLGTASVLAIGGVQVIHGKMTVGALLASYALLGRLFDPIGAANSILGQLSRVRACARRVRDAFNLAPSVPDGRRVLTVDSGGLTLCFDRVNFSYPGVDEPVLRNVSFSIRASEKVGLTGRSGSGKTTLARLIVRLYDVLSGRIALNSADLRECTLQSLRKAVIYVHQESSLYDRSIRDNLRIAAPLVRDDEIWAVLRLVQLETRIRGLSAGLNAPVGQLGVRFSGGERQRLVLARAILARPALLILDEATGALDECTERRVLNALRNEYPKQTVLLISHRPSALEWADRVIVLDYGETVTSAQRQDFPNGLRGDRTTV